MSKPLPPITQMALEAGKSILARAFAASAKSVLKDVGTAAARVEKSTRKTRQRIDESIDAVYPDNEDE